MALRAAKRVYNSLSLEFWFSQLDKPWEHFFDEKALIFGREIYRKGKVSEIELGTTDAIIHGKLEDFEGYAVLDWDKKTLRVRSSTNQKLLGESLAAAGMYEIEELVIEEIPAIAEEKSPNKTAPSAVAEMEAAQEKAATCNPSPTTPVRELVLRFSTEERGLAFEAFWLNADNQQEIPALGLHALPADQTTAGEREQLIRLASLARRAHFRFRTRKSGYIQEDLERTPGFVRKDLNLWRKYFRLEVPADVEFLKEGVQEVDVWGTADLSEEEQLDFKWDMSVHESMITEEERRWLMRRGNIASILPGKGLVRLREQDADALLEWYASIGEKQSNSLPKYMLFSLFGQSNLTLRLTPELREWQDSLFEAPTESLPAPKDILRPYQRHGVEWLKHLCERNCHCLLADEMGLGKTLQVLTLIAERNKTDKPHLIVCPASVVPVWCGEIERFYPDLRVEVVKKGNHFGNVPEPLLWICSYTQLRRHKAELESVNFGYTVLDEAQFIKNPDAKVSIACMNIKAEHRIAMSGTPLENRFLDVWTLFRFLMPGLLGTRRRFESDLQKDPFSMIERVRKQIAPFLLRRTKKEVVKDLPAKVESDLVCPLTDLQRAEYLKLTDEGLNKLGDNMKEAAAAESMTLLTLLTRLRQCCCDPALLPWVNPSETNQSGKLDVLLDRLTEIIANGHKVVIFSQFVTLLDRVEKALQKQFPQVALYQLTGKTADRAKPVKAFQKDKGAGIFLVSLKAGGTGITLHAADYVFLLDPWWNPAVEEQAVDRVHRIGQKKTVFVYRMVTAGTLEARIQKLKSEKRHLFEQTIGDLNDNQDFSRYFESLTELVSLVQENKA